MALFKKKTKPEAPMDLEAVMKKFDQESNVRVWEGKPRIAVNCVLAAFSLFCLYVTLFASWLEELRLTTFVAWIVFLGFRRKNPTRRSTTFPGMISSPWCWARRRFCTFPSTQ